MEELPYSVFHPKVFVTIFLGLAYEEFLHELEFSCENELEYHRKRLTDRYVQGGQIITCCTPPIVQISLPPKMVQKCSVT